MRTNASILTLALAVVAIAACASTAQGKPLKAGCALGGAYANATSTGKGLVSIKELNATHAQVTLGVAKTKGVTMAHFHILPSKNPVVWLLFRTTQTGGKLLTGIDLTNAKATFTITTSDLVNDLAGAPTLAWLYGNITAGRIYTNVHTVKYPAGEIACLVAKRGAL